MPLEIVCGRSKSGKTKYIYDKIKMLAHTGEEAILIVPEQYTHSAEKHLLEIIGTMSRDAVEVFSFEHLAFSTEAKMGYPHIKRINPIAKALVIKDILNDNEFSFYKKAGDKLGFVDTLSTTIDEFKKYNISPSMLNEMIDSTDDKVLKMKLRDLSLVFGKYDEKLVEMYRDCDDTLTILSKRLVQSDVYSNKYVFLDGFDTFVPEELDVIQNLCRGSKKVTLTLCMDKRENNTTLFMPTNDTARKLEKRLSDKITYTHIEGSHFNSPELELLEKSLFGFEPVGVGTEASDIKVFSLLNPLNEVDMCAQKISYLVREEGYRYRDIGIVCSNLDTYIRHIERVFEYVDIPYFADEKNDIINHHLVRFVLSLLETYIDDYSYESMFNYLKAAFVDAEPGSIALLERFIQKCGIRRSSWLDDEKWSLLLQNNYKDDDKTKSLLTSLREKYILPLAQMHENIKGRNTIKHDATVLYEYMLKLKMPETISGYIKEFESEGELRLSKEYEKLWEIIANTLDEVVLLNPDKKVSPKTFYELLVTAFSEQKVGFIPSTIDRVLVGNVERSRFDGVKALFVLGANETVFPVAPKSTGVLGDTDKEEMHRCGLEFSITSSTASYYSQYLMYRIFTTPSNKLYISYAKCGNDFKTLRKSYIIDRVCKMFSISEKSEIPRSDIQMIYSKETSKELLCQNMCSYANGTEVGGHWQNLYGYFDAKSDFAKIAKRFEESDNLSHRLSEKNLKMLIPMLSYTSVSKIERYMACGYAYFIDYIMRIEEPKEKAVDALDIGNVTHSVLEKLSREFALSTNTLASCKEADVLERIDEYINEYLSELSVKTDQISPRDAYTIKRLKDSIYLCFDAIKRQFVESDFEPLGYEIEFNSDSPLGAIEITLPDGKVINLTGKIDRADMCDIGDKKYIRVIDYKTGKKELKLDEIFYGLNVQLMVYLSKLVGVDSARNYGGALYFNVSDVSVKSDKRITQDEADINIRNALMLKGLIPYDSEIADKYDEKLADTVKKPQSSKKRVSVQDFKTIDKFLNKKLGEICSQMLAGEFDISPYKKNDFSPCDYCKYSSICRFDCRSDTNSLRYYKAISESEKIIKEMEEQLNVDR